MYLPAGTSITDPPRDGAATSCVSFHAYHEHMPIGATEVAYAIIARCADAATLDAMTMLSSHELVEAATDPELDAWYVPDPAWATWHGGELADVCLGESTVKEGRWTVERTYSSAAAKAGAHPCVPATAADDFGTAPAAPQDTVVSLGVGETKTIPVVGYARGPGDDWSVAALDPTGAHAATAALDRTTANDGTPLALRVTLAAAPSHGSTTLLVRSKRGSVTSTWPLLVLTKP